MSLATLARRRPAADMAGRQPYAYNRLSSFRVEDLDVEVTRAVYRQAADADRAAAEAGLGTVVHITDEGQSASRFAKRGRDGWPVLLDAIRAGKVSYVLVWLLDRATRQTRELGDLLDACRDTGTLILQTGSGTVIDADDPDSVAMAKITGALAEAEVAKMSKRVRRAHAEKADAGQFHGGRRRFGYNRDMSALDVAEAAVIRHLADEIIKGRTLYSLAAELNSNGTPPPAWKGVPFTMGTWTGSNIGTIMRRPFLAGIRTHKVGDRTEQVTAAWPPVLDRRVWETAVAVLSEGSRKTSPGTARRHLLSGLLRCGVCGQTLRSKTGKSTGGKTSVPSYACRDYHVQRSRAHVDAVVVAAVVARLSHPGFAAAFLPAEDSDRAVLEARIETLETTLDDMAAERALGLITARQMAKATETARAEVTRLSGMLSTMAAAAAVPVVLAEIGGNPDAAAVWDGLDLDRRRAIVDALAVVTLDKAKTRGGPFDPESVRIEWRTAGAE